MKFIKWLNLAICGLIVAFLCGGAAMLGAEVTGLQIGEDMSVIFYLFGGWLLGLLVTPIIIFFMRRRHALLIFTALLILPFLLAFSAGAIVNRNLPLTPMPFPGSPSPILAEDLATQFSALLATPPPGPILEGLRQGPAAAGEDGYAPGHCFSRHEPEALHAK